MPCATVSCAVTLDNTQVMQIHERNSLAPDDVAPIASLDTAHRFA
jgi:hypothetical protein